MAPHLWVSIDGECHISGDVQPFHDISGLVRSTGAGSIAAHLTMEQARDLRDKLDAAIAHSEARFVDDGDDAPLGECGCPDFPPDLDDDQDER
jgi:hypothetical protein